MSSSHKKVIVRMLSSDGYAGYLPTESLVDQSQLDLLDLTGKVITFSMGEVKWVCFIRDFNSGEIDNPERLIKKAFAGRPRTAGVLLRLRLTDGDTIEGLATNDVSLVTGGGLFLTPPDIRSNTQRMFVPRTSIIESEVLMVIATAAKRKLIQPAAGEPSGAQESLFS